MLDAVAGGAPRPVGALGPRHLSHHSAAVLLIHRQRVYFTAWFDLDPADQGGVA